MHYGIDAIPASRTTGKTRSGMLDQESAVVPPPSKFAILGLAMSAIGLFMQGMFILRSVR